MTIRSLPAFLLIAFGVAWTIIGLFIFYPDQLVATFGPISERHPLFILSVYSPAIAAFAVVFHAGGSDGFWRYLSRLFLWRCAPHWYAFLLVGIPLIYYLGSAVKGNFLGNPFPFPNIGDMIAAMAFMLVLGPVEEFGWRGVALPLLQRQLAPIWAGLALGIIWGMWHLPAFFLSGTPQSAWGFMPFFVGSIAVSLIITSMFNNSRGSILLPMLFHFQLNNPLWPDAQPYDTYFFVAAAGIVIWLDRNSMFSRIGAVTEVIPPRIGLPQSKETNAAITGAVVRVSKK